MMIAAALVTLVTVSQTHPIVFFPESVSDAQNVRFEAYAPEPGLKLFPKDETRPKLWYAPVGAIRDGMQTRIWYQRVNSGETEWTDQRTLCMGIYSFGKWELPALDANPPVWGGPNNVVMRRSPHKPTWGGFNVFQILRDGDVLRMVYWDQPDETGQAGAMLAASKDNGVTWEKEPGTVFTEHNDAFTIMRAGDEYVAYQTMLEDWPDKPYPDNLDKKKRVQSIRTSKDLRAWTKQEVFLRPDDQDPPETEFYLMKAFPYGQGYAGLVMKYFADPNLPNKHSAILKNEIVVSLDARTWRRPFREVDAGFWCYADPFPVDDRTHFVVWKDGGMETVSYRPLRMFGAVFGDEGSFTIDDVSIATNRFLLNADTTDGWLEIELKTDTRTEPSRIEGQDDIEILLEWPELIASGPGIRELLRNSGPFMPVPSRKATFIFRGAHARVFSIEPISPTADFFKDWQELPREIQLNQKELPSGTPSDR